MEPCARCLRLRLGCSYDHAKTESKAALRSKILSLEQQLRESNTLVASLREEAGGLASEGGSSRSSQKILGCGDSSASILRPLNGIYGDDQRPPSKGPGVDTPYPDSDVDTSSAISSNPLADSPVLLSSAASSSAHGCSSTKSSVAYSNTSGQPLSIATWLQSDFASLRDAHSRADEGASLPNLTNPWDTQDPQMDKWTNMGWLKSYTREFVSSVLSWDAIPLCVAGQERFLGDFDSDQMQFCSSALVYSLLALASKLQEQEVQQRPEHLSHQLPHQLADGRTAIPASDYLYEQACTQLWDNGVTVLPDMQAIGTLALYQANFGSVAKGQVLANEYAAAIADLCLRDSARDSSSDYDLVRTSTYCGAVSLLRYDSDPILSPATHLKEKNGGH